MNKRNKQTKKDSEFFSLHCINYASHDLPYFVTFFLQEQGEYRKQSLYNLLIERITLYVLN